MDRNHCPICGSPAETGHTEDRYQVRCAVCGPFTITGTAVAMLPNRLDADERAVARASHSIRSRTSEDDWFEINSTNIDQVFSERLPSPEKQLDSLIQWLKKEGGDGHMTPIALNRSVVAAIVGAPNADDLDVLLRWAADQGLVVWEAERERIRLTPEAFSSKADANEKPKSMPRAKEVGSVVRGTCPECGPDHRADVVASYRDEWEDPSQGVWSHTTYRVLKCCGCDTVYVQRDHVFSEDIDYEPGPDGKAVFVGRPNITYWPAASRRERPDWLSDLEDDTLRQVLKEVYQALDGDQCVLAGIGARTVLDRAMVLNGADEGATFFQKLDGLQASGVIGKHEKDILVVLTDAGSASAHRAWKPSSEMLGTIMDGTEGFLYRTLILGKSVDGIRKQVPPRPPRPKKK